MEDKIVFAFGKYMAEIDGTVTQFETEEDARSAVVLEDQKEEIAERAAAFCDARGYEGKNAVAKTRIVSDFMAYEAAKA